MTGDITLAPGSPGLKERRELVGAIVLAAGTSSRMGQAKQLMPWGDKPMVRHVVDVLVEGGADVRGIVVVVGYREEEVGAALNGSAAVTAFNQHYADDSMLRSLQVGLRTIQSLDAIPQAVLAALGDQPQITTDVVQAVITRWREGGEAIVAPRFGGQRGHPILFDRSSWVEVLAAPPVGSPRDILGAFAGRTAYIDMADDSVLRDIDTLEDYRRELERRV